MSKEENPASARPTHFFRERTKEIAPPPRKLGKYADYSPIIVAALRKCDGTHPGQYNDSTEAFAQAIGIDDVAMTEVMTGHKSLTLSQLFALNKFAGEKLDPPEFFQLINGYVPESRAPGFWENKNNPILKEEADKDPEALTKLLNGQAQFARNETRKKLQVDWRNAPIEQQGSCFIRAHMKRLRLTPDTLYEKINEIYKAETGRMTNYFRASFDKYLNGEQLIANGNAPHLFSEALELIESERKEFNKIAAAARNLLREKNRINNRGSRRKKHRESEGFTDCSTELGGALAAESLPKSIGIDTDNTSSPERQ